MSLFSKGNWTRFGIDPDAGLEALKALFSNERSTFISSAFVARTLLLSNSEMDTSVGVNPPCWPCGDAPFPLQQVTLDRRLHPAVAQNLCDDTNLTPWVLSEKLDDELMDEGIMFGASDRFWGSKESDFALLDPEVPVYGFWCVYLKREVLDDVNALKEHAAATTNGQPFRTLAGSSKTDITKALESDGLVDHISRKQFPVIIDFRTGDVWVGTATKALLGAFEFWLRRHLNNTPIERMGLVLGGDPKCVQLALNVFRDKDLYALERQEAYELAQKEKAEEGVEVEEAEEAPESPVQEEEVPEGFAITDIATYAAPEGTMVVSVTTDALITLGNRGRAAVGAHHPLDALALLKEMEGAELAQAKLVIKDNIGDGMATVSVEASSFITEATYRGLELDFQGGCNAVLEEGLQGVLFEGEASTDVARVNNWWMRYYVRLQKAERMIIEALATALEFENVEGIRPKAKRLLVQDVMVTSGEVDTTADAVEQLGDGSTTNVRKAAKKLKDSLKANLLPGESVTLTTPKGSATVSVQESEIEV